jgi:undecaprenyl-diphosphatase
MFSLYCIYMSIAEAILLGIVQGLTEFIPVSSSGHLLLTHNILGTLENSLAFDVALHVGTLIALLIFFRKDVWELFRHVLADNKQARLARLLILATIPAALAGLLFKDFINDSLRSLPVVAAGLGIVGVIMLLIDKRAQVHHDGDEQEITKKQGVLIGFGQALALMPGVSRSGASITTGLAVGLGRRQATRFSFLLAIPITAGAIVGMLWFEGATLAGEGSAVYVGMIASLISGLFAIKFLMAVISRVGLKPFAYYRIALAAIVFLFLL